MLVIGIIGEIAEKSRGNLLTKVYLDNSRSNCVCVHLVYCTKDQFWTPSPVYVTLHNITYCMYI